MLGWQWHQLDHMQIICTSPQTDNHPIFTGRMLSLTPNQHVKALKEEKCDKKRVKTLTYAFR